MADDNEFFDILYQQWALTTWAEGAYWMPERVEVTDDLERHNSLFGHKTYWDVYAVDLNDPEKKQWIGSFVSEADADFTCGLHGALGDLIRRLHEAVDEADRLDNARDAAEQTAAEALLENQELRQQVEALESRMWIE